MRQFLFCSTVFKEKQYTILDFAPEDNLVAKINYLLKHRQDAVFWPLFVKSDIRELVLMDKSLSVVLKGLTVGSDVCRIKYNGRIYEIDEITSSNIITGWWKVMSHGEPHLFDPAYVQFL